MSASRTTGLLLRLYPAPWRARYGDELEALVVEASSGRRVPLRAYADVALAGARERLRAGGLTGDGPPGERARAGSLLVLCAWALFVVAGTAVQKLSEHWQDATPAVDRGLPSAAFLTLVVAAAIGSALVLAGIVAATPSLVAFLRGGGWPAIRRRVVTAAVVTGAAVAATGALVGWAHTLDAAQRNGRAAGYSLAAAAVGLLLVTSLAAWTAAAVTTAHRLRLPARLLGLEARLAGAVTIAMGAMTAATAVWWDALAHSAPWFLAGRPAGSAASPIAPELLAAAILMLVATLLGVLGTVRALRALPSLRA